MEEGYMTDLEKKNKWSVSFSDYRPSSIRDKLISYSYTFPVCDTRYW